MDFHLCTVYEPRHEVCGLSLLQRFDIDFLALDLVSIL